MTDVEFCRECVQFCGGHEPMPYRIFTISIRDDGGALAELNAFLRSHTVLDIERKWVENGPSSFWCFCVDYHESSASSSRGRDAGKPKVDYQKVLPPDDCAVFAQLREVRKEIAQAESVPVYTLFTNEQLAQIVRLRPTTKAALAKVPAGI